MITIKDLVKNGTMSVEMVPVLKAAVNAKMSFLTVALPRFAGKSTVTNAVLALRSPEIKLYRTSGEKSELDKLKKEKSGGYIIVAEFSPHPIPGYIWGKKVRDVFETLDAGYSLQSCIHATGVEDTIEKITKDNGVDDKHASHLKLIIYIEMFERDGKIERRAAEIYEVFLVKNGKPIGQTLFKWNKEKDIFEEVAKPKQFATDFP